MKILLSFLFFFAALPGRTCPPDDFAALVPDPYESQRAVTLKKLREKYPDIEDIGVHIRPDPTGTFQYRARVFVKRKGVTEFLAGTRFDFDVRDNGNFNGSVDVGSKYRDKGINKLFMLAILKEHPTITHLTEGLSATNEANLVVALATDETDPQKVRSLATRYQNDPTAEVNLKSGFIEDFLKIKTKKQADKYRKKLIEAYFAFTPAGRINSEIGFKNITSIEVSVSPGGIVGFEYKVGQGAANPSSRIPLILKDLRDIKDRKIKTFD